MTKICDERPVECGDPACPCHEWTESPSLTYYGHRRLDVGLDEILAPEPESGLERDYTQSSPIPATPDFDHEWREAPVWAKRTTEQECAEFWFLRGMVAEQLKQAQESNRVFREMAARRGLGR